MDALVTLHEGDCLEVLAALVDASIDAVVTDPPYSLAFMGRSWDTFKPSEFQAWCEKWAGECLRVLKPGGYLLAFGGTRTYHRLACGIEDAGFEVRDSLHWIYGSGFPKSLDVSKAIDKVAPRREMFAAFADHFRERRDAAGLTQKDIARHFPSKTGGLTGCVWNWENGANVPTKEQWRVLAPMLGLSSEWLPLIERVEAEREVIGKVCWDNSANHFVPGEDHTQRVQLDITAPATDAAARWEGWGTALKPAHEPIIAARKPMTGTVAANVLAYGTGALNIAGCRVSGEGSASDVIGRWPPNVLLSGDAAAEMDRQSAPPVFPVFRYQAKASSKERPRLPDGTAWPTVKPLELMRWLVRLVTPPGGTVLDPFAGTGTTAQAAALEGFSCVLAEKDPVAVALIRQRLAKPLQPSLLE